MVKNNTKPAKVSHFPRIYERLVLYMENKLKKRSINTVIYLLLAAMLVCMVFVSVYTVASKRRGAEKTPESGDPAESAAVSSSANTPSDSHETNNGAAEIEDKPSGASGQDDAVLAGAETSPAAEAGALPANEDDEKPLSAADHYFVMPVDGFTSKAFEIDVPVWSATMCDYRAHTGVDIASPVGSEVIASSSGTVCKVWNDPMMGSAVTIDHGDGIYTTYMNLDSEIPVAVGTKVGMGQTIGCVGDTSLTELAEEPHLHLEMKIDGKYVDPLEYIAAGEYLGEYEG